MRLLLRVPEDWFVEWLRSGVTHYRDPARQGERILVTSLVPTPSDPAGFRSRELHALIPDGHELQVTGEGTAQTESGWPLRLVEASLRRGSTVAERWLAAFYALGDRTAVALVRTSTLDAVRTRELIALLATATQGPPQQPGESFTSLSGNRQRQPTALGR